MDFPFEIPAVFDASAASETGDGVPVRLSERLKAGVCAVCTANPKAVSAVKAAGRVPVGGVLGPSGISLEAPGEHDFDYIHAIYHEKIGAFAAAGARFLLLDRQSSLADMRACLLAARGMDLTVFAALTAGRGTEEEESSFLAALITLQAMGAAAVGLCGLPGDAMLAASRRAAAHASVPLFVVADAAAGQTPVEFAEGVRPLLDAGMRLAGCGRNTTPGHLAALAEVVKKYGPPEIPEEPDCFAAATEREAFFLSDDIEFSEPLPCSGSLIDRLIDLEDEQVSAALVRVESIDDAILLGRCAPMSKLPIAVRAENPVVLNAAMRYFQGRLIIDSRSGVEREVLAPLAAKYGAIIY
jgi:hypothetical protein